MAGEPQGHHDGLVVESSLVRDRRERRQESEPYRWPLVAVLWCVGALVITRVVEWPLATITDAAIALMWAAGTAYLTVHAMRMADIARVLAIWSTGIELSLRKQASVVVPYSAIVSAEARSVRWDDLRGVRGTIHEERYGIRSDTP